MYVGVPTLPCKVNVWKSDVLWLSERQFLRLTSIFPLDTRGKSRVDDQGVIGGIANVLKSGGRWVGAPAIYCPRNTLYIRFVRRAFKGV